MNITPYGEVKDDRWLICKRYSLVESINGFWRMTKKAKDNYEPISFIGYLQGKIEKPDRLGSREPEVEQKPEMTPVQEMHTTEYQKIVDEILSM